MSKVDFVVMIPSSSGGITIQKVADEDTPIRIYGGGNMLCLENGWQVFSAHTVRGRGMVMMPPRAGRSERAWRRSWIRGYWGGSGVYEKVAWNGHNDFYGQRMVIDMPKGDRRDRIKKALVESGLIHFRQIQYGATYFVCEEDI